jgi:hypothetical protein
MRDYPWTTRSTVIKSSAEILAPATRKKTPRQCRQRNVVGGKWVRWK